MAGTLPDAVTDTLVIGSWFHVALDNGIVGDFKDAGGLSVEVEVTDVVASSTAGNTMTAKRPGKTKYGEITLKRNMTSDKKFWEWAKKIIDGKPDFRTNGSITVTDMGGKSIAQWKFENAWISKWSASDPDAGSNDVVTEDITLQIELLTKEKV